MSELLSMDQNYEDTRGRSRYRKFHHVPPSLETSPYLSSPIRPIPSLRSRSRGSISVATRTTCRSRSASRISRSRASSPSHSTVVTFNHQSPYENQFLSRQSSFESMRSTVNRSDARSVLLPSEIDDLAKIWPTHDKTEFSFNFNNFTDSVLQSAEKKRNISIDSKDIDPESSHHFITDDDWSATSEFARSVNDEAVFEQVRQWNRQNDTMLFKNVESDELNNSILENKNTHINIPSPAIESNEPQIKLPPVPSQEKYIDGVKKVGIESSNEFITNTRVNAKHSQGATVPILKSSGEPYMMRTIQRKKKKRKKKKSSKSNHA